MSGHNIEWHPVSQDPEKDAQIASTKIPSDPETIFGTWEKGDFPAPTSPGSPSIDWQQMREQTQADQPKTVSEASDVPGNQVAPTTQAMMDAETRAYLDRQAIVGAYVHTPNARRRYRIGMITLGVLSSATAIFGLAPGLFERLVIDYEEVGANLPGATRTIPGSYFDNKRDTLLHDKTIPQGAAELVLLGGTLYCRRQTRKKYSVTEPPNHFLLQRWGERVES